MRCPLRVSAVLMLLSLAGCKRDLLTSVNGLVAPGEKLEVFDPWAVGEWLGPDWERVEWKIERLADSNRYFITHIGEKDERTLFTASLVKIGGLRLLDLTAAPAPGNKASKDHLILSCTYSNVRGFHSGVFRPEEAKKWAALGNSGFFRYQRLVLVPMNKKYFFDHDGVIPCLKTVDEAGRVTGIMLTATPEELREFYESHGGDNGLWADVADGIIMEKK